MTLASDFAAYGSSMTRFAVTTDKALGGTAGHLAAAIPGQCTHVALIPESANVHMNIGAAATTSTPLLPLGGIVFNSDVTPLENIHLYAAASTNVGVILGGPSLKTMLGASLSTGAGKTYTRVAIDEAADQTAGSIIATPGAGHHLEIHEVYLRCGLAGTVLLHDEDDTAITGTMPVGTNDLIFRPFNVVPCYVLAANKAFELTNVNAPLDGWIIYVDVTD